jgi:hypothetical protein
MPLLSPLHLPTMQYEPELFPGLIYRMKQPKIVLLIFVSGKVVLTGVCVCGGGAPALVYMCSTCHLACLVHQSGVHPDASAMKRKPWSM